MTSPRTVALVTLGCARNEVDSEELAARLAAGGWDLVDDPDLRAAIQQAVDDANKAVSHAEAIKKFAILPGDWTEEGGQITPSLKLKRNVVMSEYAADVEALYA